MEGDLFPKRHKLREGLFRFGRRGTHESCLVPQGVMGEQKKRRNRRCGACLHKTGSCTSLPRQPLVLSLSLPALSAEADGGNFRKWELLFCHRAGFLAFALKQTGCKEEREEEPAKKTSTPPAIPFLFLSLFFMSPRRNSRSRKRGGKGGLSSF